MVYAYLTQQPMFTLRGAPKGVLYPVRRVIAVVALTCVTLGVAPGAHAASIGLLPSLTITGGPCPPLTIKGSNLPSNLSVTAKNYDSSGNFYANVTVATDNKGSVNTTIPALPNGKDKVTVTLGSLSFALPVTVACGTGGSGGSGGGAPTPELGSGELLATGLMPIGAVLLYWRHKRRHTPQKREHTNI